MRGDIRWEGDLIANLERIAEASRFTAEDAAEGGTIVLARSDELVPKAPKKPSDDTASLVSAGYVKLHGNDGAAIGYSSVYAHWIHEHTWFHHPHGGQAKFLETAMLEKGREAVNRAGEHFFGRL
jgi:hypothetical protein